MNEFSIVASLGVLFARPGMLVASAPAFGGTFAPVTVRVGLAALLAFFVLPAVTVPPFTSPVGIGVIVARELAIGLALGLAVQTVMAGAALGGHLSGSQIGLSYGSIVDPQGGVRNNMTGSLYANLALFVFLATGGHHALLRALAASYEALPIGGGSGVDASLVGSVAHLLGTVFVLGVRLAAPVIVVLLTVEIGTALMARAAPSLNLMAVAPPLRVLVGLLAIAAVVPLIAGVVTGVASSALQIARHAADAFR